MQRSHTHISGTNHVSRGYIVAAILSLLFMVPLCLVPALALLFFYVSTFRSMCAVPNMAVFCSSLTSWFPGMSLTYYYYYYYYYYLNWVNTFIERRTDRSLDSSVITVIRLGTRKLGIDSGQYGGFTFATAFGSYQRLNIILIDVYGGKEFGTWKEPLTSKQSQV